MREEDCKNYEIKEETTNGNQRNEVEYESSDREIDWFEN